MKIIKLPKNFEEIIQKDCDGFMTVKEACKVLNLSEYYYKKEKNKYMKEHNIDKTILCYNSKPKEKHFKHWSEYECHKHDYIIKLNGEYIYCSIRKGIENGIKHQTTPIELEAELYSYTGARNVIKYYESIGMNVERIKI